MKVRGVTLDKYEHKVRTDEIRALIAEGEYVKAVEIADTVDWRKERSVMLLCTISDLYKVNRRYRESKDILLMAYERHPGGRLIVYSLCELSIKLEEYMQAVEYYKEFVQIAPKDTNRYILLYRLYEAQEVSIEERIQVLEDFKKRDYKEKWAYELAKLYHKVGMASSCVEECDEMFLWFGEGRYVIKALELKMLHEPLNEAQLARYNMWMAEKKGEPITNIMETTQISDIEASTDSKDLESAPTTEIKLTEEDDIQVKTLDVNQFNTMDLQEVVASGMKGIFSEEENRFAEEEADNYIFGTDSMSDMVSQGSQEIYFQESTEAENIPSAQEELVRSFAEEITAVNDTVSYDGVEIIKQVMKQDTANFKVITDDLLEANKKDLENIITPLNTEGSRFDHILSQEYDGQIKLAVPDEEVVEKQITGQLSIEDVLAEWERLKKENEKKRMEEVRQRIIQHTGSMFAEYDEQTRTGLLEQMEKALKDAILKETKEDASNIIISNDTIEKEAQKVASRLLNQANALNQEEKKAEIEEQVEVEEKEEEKVTITEVQEDAIEPLVAESVVEEEADDGIEELAELEEIEEEEEVSPSQESEAIEQIKQALEGDQTEEIAIPVKHEKVSIKNRELTEEETSLFQGYLGNRKLREQIFNAIDTMSMAACTGNVLVAGEDETGPLDLARNLIIEMQQIDANFMGQVAKINGDVLNKKDIAGAINKLQGGALIVDGAGALRKSAVAKLVKALDSENLGIIVVLVDTKEEIHKLLEENPNLKGFFNVHVELESLDTNSLVEYAKEYAKEQEFSIDEFGVLALHTKIDDMQTIEHEVTMAEVRDLVDDAIYYASKKTPAHFFDILLSKRYDDEDMIIIREKDFMH